MFFSRMSALMASWLTPTSLFVLLNIIIGTIFLVSRLFPPKMSHHQQFGCDGGYCNSSSPPVQRVPSFPDRVSSFNFSTYKFPLSNPDFDNHHLLHAESLAAHPLERSQTILERLKSINFSFYKYSPQSPDANYIHPMEQHDYPNPKPLSRAPSFLGRVKSIDFNSFYRSGSFKSNQSTEPSVNEEPYSDTYISSIQGQVQILQSESKERGQTKIPEKMKKSASENPRRKVEEKEKEEEEEVERRRPATTRIEKTVSYEDDDDQGVDAKADDFINKFKHQLKLQRLDSLLRYRDLFKGK